MGCVIDPSDNNAVQAGFYVAGWAKHGPVGNVDDTLRDTKATFMVMKHHMQMDQLEEKLTTLEEIEALLPKDHVTYQGWLGVDQVEIQRGEKLNKIRDKVI